MSVALDLFAPESLPAPVPTPRPRLRAVPAGTAPLRPAPAALVPPVAVPLRDVAPVRALHRPAGAEAVRPVRLTRRGVLVLGALVLAAGATLVWVASLFAPQAAPARPVPAVVTVHSGDTLWSLAGRYAGSTDPRAFVAQVEQRNHLTDAQVVPGQVLRLR